MLSDAAHSWPDVLYVALLVVLSVTNAWHNRRTAKRTMHVHREVRDVKRAMAVGAPSANRRATDRLLKPPPDPAPDARPGGRRFTDPD